MGLQDLGMNLLVGKTDTETRKYWTLTNETGNPFRTNIKYSVKIEQYIVYINHTFHIRNAPKKVKGYGLVTTQRI